MKPWLKFLSKEERRRRRNGRNKTKGKKYRNRGLEKARNIGDKSIVEIETLLKKMDLSFGMDIAIYGFGTNSISL